MKRRIVTFCLTILLAAISTFFALAAAEFAPPFLHDFSLEEAVYQVRRAVQYIHGKFYPALRYILTKIFIPRGFFISVNLIMWLIPIGLVSAALSRISRARGETC